MTPYDFEVLKDGVVIDIQSIHLPHIRFAWPEIVRLAKRFCGPGHKFRVKDDAGGIVILTGVRRERTVWPLLLLAWPISTACPARRAASLGPSGIRSI
jgi:hypothetical protein